MWRFFLHISKKNSIFAPRKCKVMNKPRNYRDYQVWQEAVAFASKVYLMTGDLPWFEKKGLCDQLQRAVVSIASNIAEGAARPTDADFAHFLDMALGSANEVGTQLTIAKNVGYIKEDLYNELQQDCMNIERQLGGFIRTIRQK